MEYELITDVVVFVIAVIVSFYVGYLIGKS